MPAPSVRALSARGLEDWVGGRSAATSLPHRFEMGPTAWLPVNVNEDRPINVQVDPRSNFRTSLKPLDYYRAPDRGFAVASRSQPRSVALDTLDFRRAR